MARYVAGAIVPNQQGAQEVGTPEVARMPENLPAGSARSYQSAIASLIGNELATGKTNAEQLARAGLYVEPNPAGRAPQISSLANGLQ